MSKPTHQMTRLCMVCGIKKPLATFLQIAGARGTTYGNICSACRAEAKNKLNIPTTPQEDDEERSGGFGLRIDSKAKIQQDIEKLELKDKKEVLEHDEKQAREQLALEKNERDEAKLKAEKDHRFEKSIRDQKRTGFLSKPQKPSLTNSFFKYWSSN